MELHLLGLHSCKLSGQQGCLIPGSSLSTLAFTDRFIITLSPPLLCPYTNNCRIVHFSIWYPAVKSFFPRDLSNLPVCSLSYHLHLYQIYKKFPTHSEAVSGALCPTSFETLVEIWYCDNSRKSVRLLCPRLPGHKWAQFVFILISLNLYGNFIDLATQEGRGGFSSQRSIQATPSIVFTSSVLLYYVLLEFFPFSSDHRIFISTGEGKIFTRKYLSNSIALFRVLSFWSSKVNKNLFSLFYLLGEFTCYV